MTDVADPVFTRKLQRPITSHGEKVTEIAFREPVSKDVSELGNPVTYNPYLGNGDVTFKEDVLTNMMARLSGVNRAGILEMTTQDRTSCGWGIAGFFLPTRPTEASG